MHHLTKKNPKSFFPEGPSMNVFRGSRCSSQWACYKWLNEQACFVKKLPFLCLSYTDLQNSLTEKTWQKMTKSYLVVICSMQ